MPMPKLVLVYDDTNDMPVIEMTAQDHSDDLLLDEGFGDEAEESYASITREYYRSCSE
jgi:hypothetical protein